MVWLGPCVRRYLKEEIPAGALACLVGPLLRHSAEGDGEQV